MKCPVCLADKEFKQLERYTDPLENKAYGVFRCLTCGADFSDPMKNPGPAWYKEFKSYSGSSGTRPFRAPWRVRGLSAARKLLGKDSPSLLDIGCGQGEFMLAAVDAGFTAGGIDFDEEKIEKARSMGLEGARDASFDEYMNSSKTKFDAVSLFQLLEHMEDPNGLIDRIRSAQSDGGLLMLDIPNRDSIFGNISGIMDYPPHHLTRWDRRVLERLLKSKGYAPVTLSTPMTLKLFFDSIFIKTAMFITESVKAALLSGVNPSGPANTPMSEITSAPKFLKSGRLRSSAMKAARILYYVVAVPLMFLPALLAVRLIEMSGRGAHIFALARKGGNL